MTTSTTDSTPPPPPAGDVPAGPAAPPRMSRGRAALVWTLLVVTTVVLVLAATNLWVKRQALDTDAWVAASDELLDDPAIRAALSQYLVDQLYANVDVGAQLEEWLPEEIQGLAGPVASALRTPATEGVDRLLATSQARAVWSRVNRTAHETLVRVLEDETRVGSTTGGVVSLDLRALVVQLGEQLGLPDAVLDRIPDEAGQIVLLESDGLAAAQDAVAVIEVLSWLLLLVVVGLYALTVWLAVGARRRMLRNVGWAVLLASVLLLVVRRLVVDAAVSQVGVPDYRPAARAALVIGTALLSQIAWAGVAYGVVIAAYAILVGPTRPAVAVRRTLAPLLNATPAFVWGGAAALYLLLVVWAPTPAFRNWWTVLLLAVLAGAGIEALRRQSRREFPGASLAALRDSTRERAGAIRDALGGARRSPTAPPAGDDTVERLTALRSLHEQGALSDDEYAAAKAKLLGTTA